MVPFLGCLFYLYLPNTSFLAQYLYYCTFPTIQLHKVSFTSLTFLNGLFTNVPHCKCWDLFTGNLLNMAKQKISCTCSKLTMQDRAWISHGSHSSYCCGHKVQNALKIYIYTSRPMGFGQWPCSCLRVYGRLVSVSREEQEREGLRAVGMGTWRKAIPEISLPPAVEVGALVWCFPVPPIPIVLKRSLLFLLVCNACF